MIKAIECLVNRLIKHQILGFILSISYRFLDATLVVSSKTSFQKPDMLRHAGEKQLQEVGLGWLIMQKLFS